MSTRKIKGVIFDLDGTLVDSQLDFARMRADLGFAAGTPILEALGDVSDPAERFRKELVILRHEYEGAERATPMPGCGELLRALLASGVHCAVFTRNARVVADYTLQRLGLPIDLVVAREDAPPKPDPAGLHAICEHWGVATDDVLFVGDYLFDLDAGRNAGIRTLLYAPTEPDFAHDCADVVATLRDVMRYIA